jgi:hypothetical protein
MLNCYGFPLPNRSRTTIEKGSYLNPFVNLMCVEDRALCPPEEGKLVFVGTQHKRGNLPGGLVAMAWQSTDGIDLLRLESGGSVYEGTGRNVLETIVEGVKVRFGEYCLQGISGREECVCVVSYDDSNGNLQIISANETFDTWYSGNCQLEV